MITREVVTVQAIEVNQPLGVAYLAIIPWDILLRISSADIRQIHASQDGDPILDNYLGIQRKVSPKRVKEIATYIQTVDASFPTNIIVHSSSDSHFDSNGQSVRVTDIRYNEHAQTIRNIDYQSGHLRLRLDENLFTVLDGQHRLEGFRKLQDDDPQYTANLKFDLSVCIYVDLDIDDQAQIFATINKAQTKVNKSLVYDLYAYAKTRSPQKTAHDIVRAMNTIDTSPYYRRVKILGTAEVKEIEVLAQATFAQSIVDYISSDAVKDRDLVKRNPISSLFNSVPIYDAKKLIFRKFYIEAQDVLILRTISYFFTAVRNNWPNAWNTLPAEHDSILSKSTGFIALFKFMREVIVSQDWIHTVPKVEDWDKIFSSINILESQISKEYYLPGSSGQSRLLKDLLAGHFDSQSLLAK